MGGRGGLVVFGVAALAFTAAGCRSPGSAPEPRDPAVSSLQDQLVAGYGAEKFRIPADERDVWRLAAHPLIVVVASQPRVPVLGTGVAAALRDYVRRGGRLLLLGYAARVAHEIGVEPVPPDRCEPYRWGHDQRTRVGRYEFGVRAERASPAAAFEGMDATRPAGDAYLVGGGEMPTVASCQWEQRAPAKGKVLARLFRVQDGQEAELDAAVLVQWNEGSGSVLAYGSLPEPWRGEPIAGNARRLVDNAITLLAGGRPASVALCVGDELPFPAVAPLPPLAQREIPAAPELAHWGLLVALNDEHDSKTPLPPARVLEDAIVRSAKAGASLVALQPADRERGLPLAWSHDDALRRPAGYHGGPFWKDWSARALHELGAQAHERGLHALVAIDQPIVRGGGSIEQLAGAKWLARELLDPRAVGNGAFDGLLLRAGVADAGNHLCGLVGVHGPGALLPKGVLDARWGRPEGLNAAGLAEGWRLPYHPSEHAGAWLDCRVRRPSPRLWPDASGGGSYGDWIVAQHHDFVRARLGEGAAALWSAYNPHLADEDTLGYVLGVSCAGLQAAVAGRLWATGKGGWRDLQRGFAEPVQGGFGKSDELSHDTPFLQNNHFRLYGSGGPLRFDPSGRARFSELVSSRFLVTHVRGARPRVEMAIETLVDFIGGLPRGEGNYGPIVAIHGDERGAARFPARLALEDAPRWPRRVEVAFRCAVGDYELDLMLRPVAGQGIVELRLGSELQALFGFSERKGSERRSLRLPIATGGMQQLALEVADGGAVAVDVCRLLRRADLAAQTRIGERAGHVASLEEHTGSTFFDERASWRTHADLPGFLWQADYGPCDRNLTVVRQFRLEGYGGAEASDPRDAVRAPFLLQPSRPGLPLLAVVPVRLPHLHRFDLTAADGPQLVGPPLQGERTVVGFLFLRDHGREALAQLAAHFADMASPPSVEIGAQGRASLRSDLPLSWPRVLKVHQAQATAYFVAENGWWLARGAQPATGGGDWLRIQHAPGVANEIACGGAWLQSARPGAGALRSMAWRDPTPQSVTARVLASGPWLAAPSIVLPAAFDEVTLEGRPWCYFDERTVYLPRERATFSLSTRATGRPPRAHLLRTDADVRRCAFDDAANLLEIHARPRADRPADALHHAWLSGPIPFAIEGGELVPDAEHSYRSADAERARAAGVVIRFRPGVVRVRYPPAN
jgi:hypothetical protein